MIFLIIFNIVLDIIFGIITNNLVWIACLMVWVLVLVYEIIDNEKDEMIKHKNELINDLFNKYIQNSKKSEE